MRSVAWFSTFGISLTFDYVFTVSHKNIMLLTLVGQMLYSMQSRRQWTVWSDGIKYRDFIFHFYSKEMFLE